MYIQVHVYRHTHAHKVCRVNYLEFKIHFFQRYVIMTICLRAEVDCFVVHS